MTINSSDVDYTAQLQGSLKLSASGEWWHNGVPFKREKLSELFHRSIVWDEKEQEYFVQIGRQRARFDLEDTAYFVISIDDTAAPWQITLNDGSTEAIAAHTIRIGREDQFYLQVKGSHQARLSKAAHQLMIRHVINDSQIEIDGTVFTIGSIGSD